MMVGMSDCGALLPDHHRRLDTLFDIRLCHLEGIRSDYKTTLGARLSWAHSNGVGTVCGMATAQIPRETSG